MHAAPGCCPGLRQSLSNHHASVTRDACMRVAACAAFPEMHTCRGASWAATAGAQSGAARMASAIGRPCWCAS